VSFPDLFVVEHTFNFTQYADYLNKKADRFGLDFNQTLDTFSKSSDCIKETPQDPSNKIFHKGEV